jgi:ATP-binding protein involved in chromosome partitioning
MDSITENMTTPADLERAHQDKMIEDNLFRIKRKILVMSGKGGVGKSTVASYLALRLSKKNYRVGLLDVDLHGPSIPRLLNIRGGFEITEEDEGERVRPYRVSDHLRVASLEMMLGDKDLAVIWRGPMKISAIRQFISDVDWGELDYLIVDSPPGTGDEPLTVAQTINDAEALLVTTPQEISLADVRKSIDFCRQVEMKILGVLENMSAFVCPHCEKTISVFGRGGGAELAAQMGIPILGEIPIEPEMVAAGDNGQLGALLDKPELAINAAYEALTEKIIKRET